jgi:hypothetical protein
MVEILESIPRGRESSNQSDNTRLILHSVLKLESHIIQEKYRGYDPFDALTSPLFELPFLRSNKFLRLGLQQILKRSVLNIRRPLGIPKGLNPVTLALCIQAFSYLLEVLPEKRGFYLEEISKCIQQLSGLRSPGYAAACWGYDFPWEARYARIPAYMPTVVSTGIVANSLYVCYEITNNRVALDLCRSAAEFVLHNLHRTVIDDTLCFSYSPYDHQTVLNATMKAARLLAQAATGHGDASLLGPAKHTVQFVTNAQKENGSWPYALGDPRSWVDNFHTGYILDCLHEYIQRTGETQFVPVMEKGFEYYRTHFFQNDGIPKYYDHSLFPVDSTSAAQSILTLSRFGQISIAENVALYMIKHMQHDEGFFYYRKTHWYTVKTSFMRWSNAWMFASLAYYLSKICGSHDPA